MKFAFSLSTVIDADSLESALKQVASHVGRTATHIANERALSDCGAKFTITQVSDDTAADDLSADPIVAEHGPAPLNLDPESPEGVAYAEQEAAATA